MSKFYMFMGIMLVLSILGSTGRIGNVLVALRCVEVRDKALSMAFQIVCLSLLAMLPSPIVFGAIIDTTCILWQQECGETTNCLLYDTDALRQLIMLITAGIMLVGVLPDGGVWYYAKNLEIFPKEEIINTENESKSKRNLMVKSLTTSQNGKTMYRSD